MGGTTESSVMFALSELQRIEGERIAEEAELEAERRRKEEERRRREREEREQAELHRLRVAEAEARLRVAEEGRAAEAAERAARLAAELQTIQTERAALSERLSSIEVGGAADKARPARRGYWAAAMLLGCLTITAAASAWNAQKAKAPVVVTVTKTVPAPAPAAVASSDPADVRRIAELEARLNKLLEKPRPRPQPSHAASASRPASGGGGATAGSLVAQIDDCAKDPLCGVKISKREGGR